MRYTGFNAKTENRIISKYCTYNIILRTLGFISSSSNLWPCTTFYVGGQIENQHYIGIYIPTCCLKIINQRSDNLGMQTRACKRNEKRAKELVPVNL